jgi:hypothetical protein
MIVDTERNIISIIQKIKEEIPDAEKELHIRIDRFVDSLMYKAPEVLLMGTTWLSLEDILNSYITKNKININQEWVLRTVSIFNDE